MARHFGITACAALLLAWVPAPVAADTPCTDHTEEGSMTCRGTCAAGDKIGVSINADDETEVVEATGTCNSSEAHCDATDGACSDKAIATAAQGGPWACSFSAHDEWYYPDNGFHYNCYATQGEGTTVPGGGDVCSALLAASSNCQGTVRVQELLDEVVGIVAARERFADVWEPGARAQRLVEVDASGARGLACDDEGCAPFAPECARVGPVLRCVVSG